MTGDDDRFDETAIAIIGMAGRFPGAGDYRQLWGNIRDGVESIRELTSAELDELGVAQEIRSQPGYVPASAFLADFDLFDAEFFGMQPREAQELDPQQRVFLECAWEALEDAGYAGFRAGRVSVYAGSTLSTYLLFNLVPHYLGQSNTMLREFQLGMGNSADFLATRVAYKLNLTGPSLTVLTGCSSSLVAVHVAAQSLLLGECDIALAGGVSIQVNNRAGYLYTPEGLVSPDGHCRPFDTAADGTVLGSGAGIVVLKRLAEALADGDSVRAVLLGSAINNDGNRKVGFTAPSVDGQAAVIVQALATADVPAETIGYVEAHGTATQLGDAIELQALTKAYRQSTQATGFCALGSIKGNIGHLDAAAGVAGLMKTVLSLQHGQVPPSLHFTTPNPGLAGSPFFVNDRLRTWPEGSEPLRAAVSAFGIGGTNAHVVLQAPPPVGQPPAKDRSWQVLMLSARSDDALGEATGNLRQHLAGNPDLDICDVAHTLRRGRREFASRRYLVCRGVADVPVALDAAVPEWTGTGLADHGAGVAFMFPGMGPQHAGMAAGLYRTQPVFREQFDTCSELLEPMLGMSARESLFGAGDHGSAQPEMRQPEILTVPASALPTMVSIEYSLAQLLRSVGVEPAALLGHSVGEYTAACLAGVFDLADCLAIVHRRGELGAALADGAMVNVALAEHEVRPLLNDDLSLAAVNGPKTCVVSGPRAAVHAWTEGLIRRDVPHWELPWPVAGHSALVDPVLAEFTRFLTGFTFREPVIPLVSNLFGTVVRAQVAEPGYWARHLRETVLFADGVRAAREMAGVLIEVGPGQSLSKLAAASLAGSPAPVIPVMRHPKNECGDDQYFAAALGRLWSVGVPVDWTRAGGSGGRNVPLPTYPFQRQRFWIAPPGQAALMPAAATGPAATIVPAAATSAIPADPASDGHPQRTQRLRRQVQDILAAVSGRSAEQLDVTVSFFQLGFESLALAEAGTAINRKFGIRIPIRLMFETLPTVQALADYLDQQLPPDVPGTESAQAPEPESPPPAAGTASALAAPPAPAVDGSARDLLAQQLDLLRRQMELQGAIISKQLDVLGQAAPGLAVPGLAVPADVPSATRAPRPDGARIPGSAGPAAAFVPFQPAQLGTDPLSPRQRRHVDDLVQRYAAKTAGSKDLVQRSRIVRANHRNVLNFRPMWKELVYPIFAAGGKGARIRDVDGNEYVDLAMSFGATMLGHAPSFVIEAISRELTSGQGLLIGPCSPHAEQVANLISELTGVERVAFFNSGTEAVMLALRLARAATGRSKIAMFAGSFHGTYDGTLVMPDLADPTATMPICPGLSPGITAEVLVLDYCSAESLEVLRRHGSELAAVLVEPVQSRRPSLEPGTFLRELRAVTSSTGTAMVFDETITGFRLHPGGAQALFGVTADLVTFGKVVGGGMPLGIVCGRASFMDGVDGGAWSFGDGSVPAHEGRRTFLGGTFCEHPLAMVSARAMLEHLKQAGPALQERLAARSARLASALRTVFEEFEAPIEVAHFGSIFRLTVPGNLELFYYHMLDNGVYLWEGRTWFLSTAHTDADLDHVVRAARESLASLRAGGFLGEPLRPTSRSTEPVPLLTEPERGPGEPERGPATDEQRQMWFLAQLAPESACVYNESIAVSIDGQIDVSALRLALQHLVDRHEALRTEFTADGQSRRVHRDCPVTVAVLDWSDAGNAERERRLAIWWPEQLRAPIALDRPPLLRATVIKYSAGQHELVVVAHHLALDGWSWGIALREFGQLYLQAAGARVGPLSEPARYEDFVRQRADLLAGQEASAARAYWRHQLADPPAPLAPAPGRIGPCASPRRGGREQVVLDQGLYQDVAAAAGALRCTPPILLMAVYQAFLYGLTGRRDFLINVPVAGQLALGMADLVGHCTNLLPVRARVDPGEPFSALVGRVKDAMTSAYEHQAVSVAALAADAPPGERPLEIPPVSTLFNVDRRVAVPALPGVAIAVRTGPVLFAHGLLSLNAIDIDGTLRLDFDYDADRFGPDLCRLWLRNFQELLAAAIRDQQASLRTLLRSESGPARKRPVAAAAEPEVTAPWEVGARTASDHIRAGAAGGDVQTGTAGDDVTFEPAVAVRLGTSRLTYAELSERASRLARRLRSLGIDAGAVVGLDLPPGTDLAVAATASLAAGGALQVLDGRTTAGPLAAVLRSDPAACARAPGVPVVSVSDPTLTAESAAEADWAIPAAAPAWVIGRCDDGAVVLTRAQLLRHLGLLAQTLGLGAGCAVAVWSPDDPALVVERLLLTMTLHGVLHVLPEAGLPPEELVGWLAEIKPDLAELPSQWRCPAAALDRLGELRTAGTTRLPGIPVTVAAFAAGASASGASGCIGALAGSLLLPVSVRDEDGEPRAAGVPGRLCLDLPCLAPPGLNGRPAAQFLPTGYYARWTPRGDLDLLGPATRAMQVAGETVWLNVVEAALRELPGVADAVVVAQTDAPGQDEAGESDEYVVGYVTATVAASPAEREQLAVLVRAHATAVLPASYVPRRIAVLEEISRTPAGLLARDALPRLASAPGPSHREPTAGAATADPDAADIDQRLLAICQDLLGCPVTLDSGFLDLGGTSLLAIRALARIQRDLGVLLPLAALIRAPTLGQLADAVRIALRDGMAGPDDDPEPPLVAADSELASYPLSSAQLRIWYVDQMGGDRSYVVPMAIELSGRLNLTAFRVALDAVVSRHEALRTTFPVVAGEPVQLIGPPFHVGLDEADLSHLPAAEQQARAADYYRSESDRSFDLAVGPLFRVGLLRLAEDQSIVIMALHHIITDGWSGDVLLEDFLEHYLAHCSGRPPSLPELPIQYRDFAIWQREWLAGRRGQLQLEYWRRELGTGPLVLELPTDRPRSPVQTFNGSDHRIVVPAELTEALRRLGRAEGVTLFSTMLGAFVALLKLYSGQDDIVVGTPSANRNRIEVERLVGCFLNMLAIRTNLADRPTFGELIRRVQDRVTAAHAHQDIPMERLVRELAGGSYDPSSPPLFQVLFVLNEVPPQRQVTGLKLAVARFPRAISKYDLSLIVDDTGAELLLDFQYNTDLFDAATIGLMADRLRAFLANVLADPAARL